MAVIIGFTALHLWVQGYFYIMGKDTAPGGKWSITLYSRAMGTGSSNLPWVRGGYSYIVRNADKRRGEYRVTYPKSEYMGHWWSPDGERMVMENREGGTIWILMTTWAKSNVTIMNNVFSVCRYRIPVPAMEQGRQNAAYILLHGGRNGRLLLVRC